jgi:hypothetical protein
MKLSLGKYLFYFIVFFAILFLDKMSGTGSYAETNSDSFAKLWKATLLVMMLLWLFNKGLLFRNPKVANAYYGLSIKNLINLNLMPLRDLSMTLKLLNLPVLISFFSHYLRKKNAALVLFVICQFYILTYPPFLTGLLDGSYNKVYGDDTYAFVGIFQNPHSAAVTMSICVTYILFVLKSQKRRDFIYNRTYNYLLLTIGLYGLYSSYARMGWLMAVIGVVVVFFPKRFKWNLLLQYTILMLIATIIAIFVVKNNDVLYRRLTDQDVVNGWERESHVGSGRLIYWNTSLELFAESGLPGWVIGTGYDAIPEYQQKKNGLHILSHNGFIDVLVSNGIVGLIILIVFFTYLFSYIRSYKNGQYYRLLISVYLSYLAYWVFQGTVYFSLDLLVALSLSLPKHNYEFKTFKRV